MSFFGGGKSSAPSTPSTTTSIVREAPGVESRKLELMDIARQVAQQPINLPDIQVAPLSALEQQGITAAGTTGVGAGTLGQGIQSILGAPTAATTAQQLAGQYGAGAVGSAGLGQQQAGQAGQLANLYGAGALQTAAAGPNVSQFLNPYQQYVIDEINRQSQMEQNRLAAQAVGSGAFGGGRQGIQAAEQERARLGQIGQLQATGFQTALGAAQRQQQLATQTGLQAGQLGLGAGQLGLSGAQLGAQTGLQAGQLGLSGGQLAAQTGLAAGQQLGALGQTQQQMAQQDINQLFGAGGVQRQLAQAALDAQRQSTLQQQYEPYQRAEFLANLYAAGPKSQSGLTMGTAPTTSPLAQAVGTGIGAFTAYQGVQNQ